MGAHSWGMKNGFSNATAQQKVLTFQYNGTTLNGTPQLNILNSAERKQIQLCFFKAKIIEWQLEDKRRPINPGRGE